MNLSLRGGSDAVSPTAHYTGQVWVRNGLSPPADGCDYLFELANRNKRGIALDVTAPAGRAVFERLVRWADVYITNQLHFSHVSPRR